MDENMSSNTVCPKCGEPLSEGQRFCPKCGTKYHEPGSKTAKLKKLGKRVLIGLLIALGLFVALIVVILCMPDTHKHDWVAATCTEPKTCADCGETEGEALGHTPGEWELDEPSYTTATVWLRQKCTVCGTQLDSELKKMSTLCENGELLLTPDEFTQRYGDVLNYCFSEYGTKLVAADSDSVGCCIVKNGSTLVGTVLFFKTGDSFIADKDAHGIVKLTVGFKSTDKTEIVKTIVPLVMTVDPSLEFEEAKSIAVKFFDDPYTYNGIRYAFAHYAGAYYMNISIK